MTRSDFLSYRPWNEKKHFWTAVVELGVGEMAPWVLAKVQKNTWADVTPKDWWRNLNTGWELDNDGFFTNYLEHPYHGSIFYNVGRVNGYNFWESSAWALSGSTFWEYFAENTRPSYNDLINTTVSGITLGEITYRLSAMVTDNTASGSKRYWREFFGGLINPVRGINRLINGEATKIFANPEWRDPEKFIMYASGGMRSIDRNGDPGIEEISEEGAVGLAFYYGNPFKAKEPFSFFKTNVRIGSGTPKLNIIEAVGFLTGTTLFKSQEVHHRLNLTFEYDFYHLFKERDSDSAYYHGILFGSTTLNTNFLSEYKLDETTSLITRFGLVVSMMASTPTDHFYNQEGRWYDFGPGVGFKGEVYVRNGIWDYFSMNYYTLKIFTISEPEQSKHTIHMMSIDVQLPLYSYFAIGLNVSQYWRISEYEQLPTVKEQYPIGRLFFVTALQ